MKIVSTPNGDESLSGVKEVKRPTQRNELRSMVWNHFKKVKKPDNKVVAVCNYCSRTFVAGNAGTNTGTNNLRIHLKRKHAELIGFVDSINKKSISTPNGDQSLTVFEEVKTPIHGKSKSMVWDHFKEFKKPDKEIVAVCNYCSRSYVAGDVGTNTLRYHLKRKHAEIFGEPADCSHTESVSAPNGDESVSVPNGDESVSGCEDVKPPPNKKQRSMVWHHYKKVKKPNDKTVAVCNYCSRNFVAGAAGTNHLRNHLKRKHAKHVELIVPSQS